MKLEKILEEILNLKPEDAKDELELADIEAWDSMTHMLLITRIEDDYELEFTQDDIVNMQSVGQIREILKKYGKVEA